KAVSYVLTPAGCAGDLAFGKSTWKLPAVQGKVTGPGTISRVATPKDLSPWESQEIGTPESQNEALGGHDLYVTSSGNGIKLTKDEFDFVFRRVSGDFEITALVECVNDPAHTGQGGLMVRDTLDPFSAHAFISLSSAPPAGGGAGTLK